jgi:hypothetical protein
MWYRHTEDYYSALKRREILIHASTQMSLEETLSDSTQLRSLEESHSLRQKVA